MQAAKNTEHRLFQTCSKNLTQRSFSFLIILQILPAPSTGHGSSTVLPFIKVRSRENKRGLLAFSVRSSLILVQMFRAVWPPTERTQQRDFKKYIFEAME